VRDSLNSNVGGRTLLMHAAFGGDLDIVIRLLGQGSDPNAHDEGGDTALMFAAMRGHLPVVRALLAHGADPLALANNGWTALQFAESRHHEGVAALLRQAEEEAYREAMRRIEAEMGGEAR